MRTPPWLGIDLSLQALPPHMAHIQENPQRGSIPPITVSTGVPGSYANAGHAPGHAPQPTHSISTAPEMVNEGRVWDRL